MQENEEEVQQVDSHNTISREALMLVLRGILEEDMTNDEGIHALRALCTEDVIGDMLDEEETLRMDEEATLYMEWEECERKARQDEITEMDGSNRGDTVVMTRNGHAITAKDLAWTLLSMKVCIPLKVVRMHYTSVYICNCMYACANLQRRYLG